MNIRLIILLPILLASLYSCGNDLKDFSKAMDGISEALDSTSKAIGTIATNIDSVDSALNDYFKTKVSEKGKFIDYSIKNLNLRYSSKKYDSLRLVLDINFEKNSEKAEVLFACPKDTKDWEVVEYEVIEK